MDETRLIAVGILVVGVSDVEQLLADGGVLRPEGLRSLLKEARPLGKLGGVGGHLLELELRHAWGVEHAQYPGPTNAW